MGIKIIIIILINKFESVTLVRRELKQEKLKKIPESKTNEKFCQTCLLEELHGFSIPKIDQKQSIQLEEILKEKPQSSTSLFFFICSEMELKSYKI